jgi:hypothetical protein
MERQFLRVVSTGVNGVAEDEVLQETLDFPGFCGDSSRMGQARVGFRQP